MREGGSARFHLPWLGKEGREGGSEEGRIVFRRAFLGISSHHSICPPFPLPSLPPSPPPSFRSYPQRSRVYR